MALDQSLRKLRSGVAPLERLIEAFAASLEAPRLRPQVTDLGFRYDAPDIRHFCLLKAVRVVSALNASLVRDKVINEQLGKTLDKIADHYGETRDEVPAAERLFRTSRAFSFYVHARYLECMDLYGGRPGSFHLRGIRRTGKMWNYSKLSSQSLLLTADGSRRI